MIGQYSLYTKTQLPSTVMTKTLNTGSYTKFRAIAITTYNSWE